MSIEKKPLSPADQAMSRKIFFGVMGLAVSLIVLMTVGVLVNG